MARGIAICVGLLLVILVLPSAASAEPNRCEEVETALRFAAAEYGWMQEQIDAYVAEATAECWAELRAEEAAAARENAEVEAAIKRNEEREAAVATRHQRERLEREREARQQERQQARERRRHRREWAQKPTVTEHIARYFARKMMMHSGFPIWRVDCRGGRIDRTHWRCKVAIFYHCLRGRIRVTGAGHKDHRAWYRARGSELRPCRP